MNGTLRCWIIGLVIGILGGAGPARAQAPTVPAVLREASLRTDTATYYLSRHNVLTQGETALYFWFRRDDETLELRLYPANAAPGRPLRCTAAPIFSSSTP